MILLVFTVYDQAVKAYNAPMFMRSKGEALRSFADAANDEKSNIHRFSRDYSLWYVGTFDDSNCAFEVVPPERLVGAHEVLYDDDVVPAGEVRKRMPI